LDESVEVDMSGDVAETGAFENIFKRLMPTIRHQCSAGKAIELPVRISVVDGDHRTACQPPVDLSEPA
jgi:hypothetical protein